MSGIAVVTFALLATGCGAANPEALLKTPDTPPAAQTPVPPGATVASDAPAVNEIANANAKPGDLVKISAITPKKFAKAHCDKSIIVVLYQPGSDLDEALLAQAKLAAKGRKQLVTMLYTPSQVKDFGDLPSKLGLLSTPGLAIVDRSGRIQAFWTSYVDYQLIAFQLDRAAAAKPCKVSSDEVPAAGSALGDAAAAASGDVPPGAPHKSGTLHLVSKLVGG